MTTPGLVHTLQQACPNRSNDSILSSSPQQFIHTRTHESKRVHTSARAHTHAHAQMHIHSWGHAWQR